MMVLYTSHVLSYILLVRAVGVLTLLPKHQTLNPKPWVPFCFQLAFRRSRIELELISGRSKVCKGLGFRV